MTDLQIATYIVVIVGVSIFILLVIGLVIAALVLKHKINEMERNIKGKFNLVKNMPFIGKEVFKAAMRASHQD